MKNLLVGNMQNKSKRYKKSALEKLIKAQLDNSLELLWDVEDIVLLTNFKFEYKKVKAIKIDMNDFCLTGSKMFGIQYCFKNLKIDDIIWSHDFDAWQNCYFDEYDLHCDINSNHIDWGLYDVGATLYSRPKFNGGSLFWKPSSIDIIDYIVDILTKDKATREEPTINETFKDKKFSDRVAILNNTFNVGCSGFVPRWERSIKPIRVCHLHPTNRIAWETHTLDRNGQDMRSLTPRLEQLLRRYYPDLATEMRPDGIAKASKIRGDRVKKMKEGM
jgi:hypothetical protein